MHELVLSYNSTTNLSRRPKDFSDTLLINVASSAKANVANNIVYDIVSQPVKAWSPGSAAHFLGEDFQQFHELVCTGTAVLFQKHPQLTAANLTVIGYCQDDNVNVNCSEDDTAEGMHNSIVGMKNYTSVSLFM